MQMQHDIDGDQWDIHHVMSLIMIMAPDSHDHHVHHDHDEYPIGHRQR